MFHCFGQTLCRQPIALELIRYTAASSRRELRAAGLSAFCKAGHEQAEQYASPKQPPPRSNRARLPSPKRFEHNRVSEEVPRARESNSTVVLRVSEALASRVGFWGVLVFGVGGVVSRRRATTRCRRPKAFGFGSPRPAPRSGFEFFVSWRHALWAPELGRYTAQKTLR